MTTAPVPGAKALDANALTSDMMLPILAGPLSSVVSLQNLSQWIASDTGDYSNTNITTVGAGTLTAAALLGGVITRSGSTAAYTDTTATAAQIVAALGADTPVGTSRFVWIKNTVAFAQTLAAGSGVTLAGQGVIPPLSVGFFLLTVDSLTAVTLRGVSVASMVGLPPAQYATEALESGTIAAASVAGAQVCEFINTGTTPGNLQMPTAANLVAAIPNAAIGLSYILEIRNGSGAANTATITTNTGITLTGTMTIAQNVTRRFIVTLTSLTAVTVQSMGISAAGA